MIIKFQMLSNDGKIVAWESALDTMPAVDTILAHLNKIYEQIRKIRDQFGDDKCWMDWDELFKLLPEGYSRPEEDTEIQLEHCKQYLKCLKNGTKYLPPPRWKIGQPDREGLWVVHDACGYCAILVLWTSIGSYSSVEKCFGPIPT